uniref:Zinc finger MYM-type protein 5 n=1 Tax=Cajanus cajan TaxID=3821 RepID=A0A151S609_CAJCA|nr:Zinc finger MYM-type protein 5 [Cajanus cajan]
MDKYSRHFSFSCYIQNFPNREKYERRWLIYSKDLDKVFCFCCKLLNTIPSISKLANEGSRDWRNISAKLKSHDISNEHITNMSSLIDLEMRLTIDKHVQDRINKDRVRWRNVLLMIIAIVKTLGKNNLAFRGTHEKIYQEVFIRIDVAIYQLKGLVSFFEKYREKEFEDVMIFGKEIATEMCIEPKFDQANVTIQTRFEQFKWYMTPINILNYVKRLDSFPNVYIIYKIMLTVPVIVDLVERSFSKLKLIKSYLRSILSQERLNGLTLLWIENDMLNEIDYNNLINNFASQKAQKINFK